MGIGFNPQNFEENGTNRIGNNKNNSSIINTEKNNRKSSFGSEIGETKFQNTIMSLFEGKDYNKGQMKDILKGLPDGLSRFKYDGGKFSFFKDGDKFQMEFHTPKNFDWDNFYEELPLLEEITAPEETDENTEYNTDDTETAEITDVNGAIDSTTMQGATGDCWLLTGVLALSTTEEGKQAIADAITVNDDNTVTVTFNGLGVSYTLTAEEISKYDTDSNLNDAYSNGDNDMLVLELATEKLWADINSGKVTIDSDNEDITYTGEGNGIDDGGLPMQIIYYLTGVESTEYYNDDLSNLDTNTIYSILEEALESESTTLNFCIYNGKHSTTLTDGSTYTIDVGTGGHAYTITSLTSDTVTFVNPWDSSTEYTVSWEDFQKLGIGYISSSDLSTVNYSETVTDMTTAASNSTDTESADTKNNKKDNSLHRVKNNSEESKELFNKNFMNSMFEVYMNQKNKY